MKAFSDTSTLIRFYRSLTLLPIFKELFKKIHVPSECWIELQKRPTEPENLKMSQDIGIFLFIEDPAMDDEILANKLILTMSLIGRGLDYPEAIAIAMAHNRNLENTLSEDGIARATPYRVKLRTKVYNSLDVLALASLKGIIKIKSKEEFLEIVKIFENESKEKVRNKQLKRVIVRLFPKDCKA